MEQTADPFLTNDLDVHALQYSRGYGLTR